MGPVEVCEKDEEQTEDREDLSLESKTSLSALIELLAEMRPELKYHSLKKPFSVYRKIIKYQGARPLPRPFIQKK